MPSDGGEDREHITSGPRWDRILPAVQESIRVVKKLGKGQGGWKKAMLDSYEAIEEDWKQAGHLRDEYIVHWGKGELWDPRHSGGWDKALVGQIALSDLRRAEELLMQVEAIRSFLFQPLLDDERGWTEELVSSMELALGHLADCLRAGQYLTREDFAQWNRALGEVRFIRHGDRVYKSRAPEISYIKDGPLDGWWDQVRYFDCRLVDVAGLDVERT